MKTVADPFEQALDDALDMTFPASDPIAVFVPVSGKRSHRRFVPAVLPEGKHPFVIRRLAATEFNQMHAALTQQAGGKTDASA